MHSPITSIPRSVAASLRTAALTAALIGAAGVAAQQASTAPITTPVTVDLSALPALGAPWREDNPYRGDAQVAEIGRALFNQACARCHGDDGNATHHVGTDLRRLDSYCFAKIKDLAARRHCLRDNDHYFKESVLRGKIRVGVTHMPPWEGVLTQEAVWSLRTFLESRRP